VDVTPRPAPDATSAPKRRRNVRAWIALAVVLAALGWIVVQGLGSATVYFKTADEAVTQKAELGTKRIRVEGVVQDDVQQVGDGVRFTIAGDTRSVAVRHMGDPPQLFKPGIPVVLEGHWAASGNWYESDRIMVKHSSEYKAKHPDRVTTTTVDAR
jgi:cytochrome c-type biogenesis protein CcmE